MRLSTGWAVGIVIGVSIAAWDFVEHGSGTMAILVLIVGAVVWLSLRFGYEIVAPSESEPTTMGPVPSPTPLPAEGESLATSRWWFEQGELVAPVVGSDWFERGRLLGAARATSFLRARLVREPSNPSDSGAILVVAAGESVGYIERELAAGYAPVLDELGAEIGCWLGIGGGQPFVSLPTLDALRDRARR